MANKIIEGLWDCPYCGQKGISGLTKSCPNCAHPQDEGTKFYLGNEKKAVDVEKAKDYGKGADWTCAFCGSLNRYHNANCTNCGAERADSSGDYFENRKKEAAGQQPSPPPPAPKKRKLWPILLGIAAIIALIVLIARPKAKDVTVSDKTWTRSIAVEEYATLRESDWSVPQGGRLVNSHQEIRRYEQVLDHYATEAYEVGEEVLDGYDTYTDYEDNGDGTFTEVTWEEPRYRTEYHTEYREVPVYRQEPVYDTMYDYDIERWVHARDETARGAAFAASDSTLRDLEVAEPYWPETRLGGNEREEGRSEEYILYFTDKKKGNTYSARVSQALWEQYSKGAGVELKVQGSRVLEIDGVSIS